MGHLYTRGLRQHFMKFRRQVLKEIVVEDVNVQGPVVEEVLNQKMMFENCKFFLKDQGYTPIEVNKISDWAKDHARELL